MSEDQVNTSEDAENVEAGTEDDAQVSEAGDATEGA